MKLVDLYTHKVFYDKLTFVYLEMPEFNKTEDELDSMFDKWLFLLRNLASLLERPRALQNRVFDRLFETAEIAKFTKTELSEYWDSLKNFRDWYSVISTAEKKGIEIGMEKGREEGREEGRKLGREEGREEERKEFLQKICSLIQKKLEKGKTISEIADDLEDTEENIAHLIEEFHLGRKES